MNQHHVEQRKMNIKETPAGQDAGVEDKVKMKKPPLHLSGIYNAHQTEMTPVSSSVNSRQEKPQQMHG